MQDYPSCCILHTFGNWNELEQALISPIFLVKYVHTYSYANYKQQDTPLQWLRSDNSTSESVIKHLERKTLEI